MNLAGAALMCIGAGIAIVGLLSLVNVSRLPDGSVGAHPGEPPVCQRPLSGIQISKIQVPSGSSVPLLW